MSLGTAVRRKLVNALAVWTMALSLLVGMATVLVGPAAAQTCERSDLPTAGDWVVSDTQVCDGFVIVMDGNLSVTGSGSLTIRNGGLKFVEDALHIYSMSVAGVLAFENSKVWTETKLLQPYLKLNVTISGTLTASGTTFAFPGWFSTVGAAATFSQGSLITKTETDLSTVFNITGQDDNDDAPVLTFDSSTIGFYASRVEHLYENSTLNRSIPQQSIRLLGTTSFTAVDTFLGIDFSDRNDTPSLHNTLLAADTSRAYLYGITVDITQSPPTQDQWRPAIDTTGTTAVYLYRFANVRVVDSNNVPVPGAMVTATFAGPEAGFADFPDNPGFFFPPANVLGYLGKTSATWNETDAMGSARMPLLSEWINSTTLPNSRFVGTFSLGATFGANAGSAGLTFPAYPALDANSTFRSATVTLGALTLPLPDLIPRQPTFAPSTPKEGQNVLITAPIWNQGAGGAREVFVQIFDGTMLLANQSIPFIAPGGQQSVFATLQGPNATAGVHDIRVSADPNNNVYEGPVGSMAERNNTQGFPLRVTALGPDLIVDVSFFPSPGFLDNPVQLNGSVTNVGDRSALNVQVNFYVQLSQPDGSSTPVATATLANVSTTATASVNWTPTATGTFRIWAWVDPMNVIPEPAPYSESNNTDWENLTVQPAPDLVTFSQDLTMSDPFPRVNVAGTIEGIVRNVGQNATTAFSVEFSIDGSPIGTQRNFAGLAPGQKWVTSMPAPPFAACGVHTVGIFVDSGNGGRGEVPEGSLYEMNNHATNTVQVFPDQHFTWSSGTITADQSLSSSLEITGPVSISGASISIIQDQDPCGRYYVKVLDGGSLTFSNASLTSNWPLDILVAANGAFTADGSTLTLNVQGTGVLHSKGTLTVRGSTIDGDVVAKGTDADLRGDAFEGALLHVDTTQTSRLWDSTFPGVTTIELASDAPGRSALDFDIRNVTFSAALTSQLTFSGDQNVSLTSVDVTKPGDWWLGMLAQNAHVGRYQWLTVDTVDGTGTLIEDQNTTVTLQRFNATAPSWDPAPSCAPDDCYFNSNSGWPVGVPTGRLLYRAHTEDRYGSSGPSIRATYQATGTTFVEGQLRTPDQNLSALVSEDTTITLSFSALTPDLSVTAIRLDGENGINETWQPINRPLTLTATVENTGYIITRSVLVNFYSTDVDVDRDGYMDKSNATYASEGDYLGSAPLQSVDAGASKGFTISYTPAGVVQITLPTISAVVDPPTGADPRSGGAVHELKEANNTFTTVPQGFFIWPDLHLANPPPTVLNPSRPIVGTRVTINVTVSNEGTGFATNAVFRLFDATSGLPISTSGPVTESIASLVSTTVTLTWIPTAAGQQIIQVRAAATGHPGPGGGLTDWTNWDFDALDNFGNISVDVGRQPDLTVSRHGPPPSPFRGAAFGLNVTVNNTGDLTVRGIDLKLVDNASGIVLGWFFNLTVPQQRSPLYPGSVNITINATSQVDALVLGVHALIVTVDVNRTVNETSYANNNVTITVNIVAPRGHIELESPAVGTSFKPGQVIVVSGYVRQENGVPIGNVTVSAWLARDNTNVSQVVSVNTDVNTGQFSSLFLPIPEGLPDGSYVVRLAGPDVSISGLSRAVDIRVPLDWWKTPFLGLALWIWILVIIGAAVGIGSTTAYVKFVGLGKLVECGECGSFIPEDSAKCPKCGVEFEKDMAKCSNCQAWIPVDVKQCPECGVEFATGEVEMADYEAQMRAQYDDVKKKFRGEAQQELGRSLSDQEFDDWWRTQPTFVTFEQWLREEEEMRRMGSKPCPACNTLNSVTATVCHKCGTLLKEEPRKKGAAPAPRAAAPAAQPPTGGPAAEGGAPPSEAIPKKVVKKPVMGAPVVQKKVIKRPVEEEEKKEGEEGGDEGEQI